MDFIRAAVQLDSVVNPEKVIYSSRLLELQKV